LMAAAIPTTTIPSVCASALTYMPQVNHAHDLYRFFNAEDFTC
jgi:hypothetical protein